MAVEQGPKTENKELKKVSRVHFLIHHGFLSEETLLKSYIEKAHQLKENEIMVAFTYSSREDLKRDLEEERDYTQKLGELRGILGNRLIVIADNFDITSNPSDAAKQLDKIRRIVRARGYVFNRDVATEAYGELMSECVAAGAHNLSIAGKFKKKTVIQSELTDAALRDPEIREFKKKDVKAYDSKRLEVE